MKKLRDFKKPEWDKPYSFWGPAGIGLGITLLLNDFQVTTESISFELEPGPVTGMFLFVLGILLIIGGSLAIYLITQERKVALARAGLANGLLIFFWGTRVFNALHKTNPAIGFGVGWPAIIVGLVLIIMGYIWAPK